MNTYKRYLAIVATAIICTASLPLAAMRTIKKTARRKMEELYQHGNNTTKQFLQTMNYLATKNPYDSKKRTFIAENISKMDTETLAFANSELEDQAPALSTLIKKEIEKKKLSLETNKRKRKTSPEKKDVKKKKTNNEQKTCCPICQKNILKGYNPVTLPCKHSIHANCFLKIFKETLACGDIEYICPFCKKKYSLKTVLSLIDKKIFISHRQMIDLKNSIIKNEIAYQIEKGEKKGAKNLISNITLFSNKEINDLLKIAIQNNDSRNVSTLFNDKKITPIINYQQAFWQAEECGNVEVLTEILISNPDIQDIFYTETIKKIIDFLTDKKTVISIQDLVKTLFPDASTTNGYTEYLYHISFIILIALSDCLDEEILKKTFQEDPNILITIAQSTYQDCPISPKESIIKILLNAINLNDHSMLEIFLTQETITAFGQSAQAVINDIFKDVHASYDLDSLETILNNTLFAAQLTENTIFTVFSKSAIDRINPDAIDVLIKNKKTKDILFKINMFTECLISAVEKNDTDIISSLIQDNEIAKFLVESNAWECACQKAFLSKNKDSIEILLQYPLVPKGTIENLIKYINRAIEFRDDLYEFSTEIKKLLSEYPNT